MRARKGAFMSANGFKSTGDPLSPDVFAYRERVRLRPQTGFSQFVLSIQRICAYLSEFVFMHDMCSCVLCVYVCTFCFACIQIRKQIRSIRPVVSTLQFYVPPPSSTCLRCLSRFRLPHRQSAGRRSIILVEHEGRQLAHSSCAGRVEHVHEDVE